MSAETFLIRCELKSCLPQIYKVRSLSNKRFLCFLFYSVNANKRNRVYFSWFLFICQQALLTASCASCPSDPIQFLKNILVFFQGHDNIEDVDW